ncbi:hypothetical protein OROMI_012741 [Orobanche minor]
MDFVVVLFEAQLHRRLHAVGQQLFGRDESSFYMYDEFVPRDDFGFTVARSGHFQAAPPSQRTIAEVLRRHSNSTIYWNIAELQCHAISKAKFLGSHYGDEEKSFQAIAKYLYMLGKMNPGSEVDLLTGDDSKFKYCFFALSASIRAFRACRPVIVIDATHLNEKYKGVMFVASTKDGNEQIVPLAFGIGDKEKDESWTWFLEHVRKSF